MNPSDFAEWRGLGLRYATAAYLGTLGGIRSGWFTVCASCETQSEQVNEGGARWAAELHNSGIVHAVGIRL